VMWRKKKRRKIWPPYFDCRR